MIVLFFNKPKYVVPLFWICLQDHLKTGLTLQKIVIFYNTDISKIVWIQ